MSFSTSSKRPFRFSLQVANAGSRPEWVDLVKRADDAGFDMIVTADHLEWVPVPADPARGGLAGERTPPASGSWS